MESSPSGPTNALSPAASGLAAATSAYQGGPHSHAVNNHLHAHGMHLAPPLPSSAHPHLSAVGGAHHHPTPPSMISPEPSPQASGTSASMHSSPSPPTPRLHGSGAPLTTAELWEIVQKSQSGQKRLSEAQVQLSPSVLKNLFPLTWARCQAGSGSTFDGVYAVGVNEGHTVDIKACMREPPTHTPGATSSSSSNSSKKAIREEEQEEGEAEEDNPPSADDEDSSDPDVYRDHPGARWCWPFTSGDHVVHVAALGKSLIWELARAEVGGAAPYRGAEGINVIY